MNRKKVEKKNPSEEFVQMICDLYCDVYDDRVEDSRLGGEDWQPGVKAAHMSLECFRRGLKDKGIELSTAKIRKILITGGCWTTERSREVSALYKKYKSIKKVAAVLEVSKPLVTMYLPYEKAVYDLEDKSGNAKRIERFRKRKT